MDSFNGLTPAQAERLAMLAEEAGEIVQIVGKILRHGMYSYHPNNPRKSNAELLGGEVADLLAVIKQMSDTGDGIYAPSTYEVELALARKLKYSHHQGVYEAAAISALNTITPMLTAPLRAELDDANDKLRLVTKTLTAVDIYLRMINPDVVAMQHTVKMVLAEIEGTK